MKFTINPEIAKRYPNLKIGYVVADIKNAPKHEYVETLKADLINKLMERSKSTSDKVLEHEALTIWKNTFTEFGVKPKDYPSSVTALTKRVLKGQGIWNISSVVDLYNCNSVMGLVPMGGYDMDKVNGDLELRYGREGETFMGLGAKKEEMVTPKHVVYADNDGVKCWLWNYKDAQKTSISPDTTQAVFFLDCVDYSVNMPDFEATLAEFVKGLEIIGSVVNSYGFADAKNPVVDLSQKKTFAMSGKPMLSMLDNVKVYEEQLRAEKLAMIEANRTESKELGIKSNYLASDPNINAIKSMLNKCS